MTHLQPTAIYTLLRRRLRCFGVITEGRQCNTRQPHQLNCAHFNLCADLCYAVVVAAATNHI